ncbi:MAG: 3-isopropylmalate dehydratase small subunit [Oscillospiraceae bacterium]|nr:MAG: 3-isopropylmalate dehydratase small subunit [Oscillospiraceae bacterium]
MKFQGKAVKYGDNVDTDVIIPARYLNISDKHELALHAMEDIDPDFTKKVCPGDILVAGENFGCGSSREHAPLVLKESGISCIIARSFARIFYRNAINIGLPVIECPPAADAIAQGHSVTVDTDAGRIYDNTQSTAFSFPPMPGFIKSIVDAGGLMESIKAQENKA